MYPKHRKSLLSVAVLSMVVLALFVVLPSPAAASSGNTAATEVSAAFQGPIAPTFAIPGVFSLNLGQGFTSTPEGITLDSAEVAIPAVNAVASVEGLSLDQNFRLKDWGAILVTQESPRETDTYSISNATVAVGGPSSGFSTVASANVDLHGNDNVKLNGTFGVAYDGLARMFGVGMRDANVALQAGPLNVTLAGANSQPGGMTIDSVTASVAETGSTVAVSGFQSGPAGMDWDSLDASLAPVAVGNALVVSPMEIHMAGSATGYATSAVVGLALNAGDVAQVHGDVVTTFDPATRTTQFALQNAGAEVAVRDFSLGFDGMNLGPTGTSVDNVSLQAGQVGLTAEINGLTVDPNGQAAFNTAMVQYQPQGADARPGSGFVMQINRTDDGYVMTTTTLLPTASR